MFRASGSQVVCSSIDTIAVNILHSMLMSINSTRGIINDEILVCGKGI